jgi:hypothetical protein
VVRASPAVASVALAAAVAAAACRRAPDTAPPPERAREARVGFDAALAEGDRLYAERHDPTRLEAALAAYRGAAAQRPGDPGAELRLARAEAFRGLSAAAEERDAWETSARAAERALRTLAPDWAEAIDRGDDPAAAAARVDAGGAEALYLLAQGAMRSAQARGYAAVLAVKDGVLAMMSRAVELDERLDAAGPHRALGAWRAALPVAAGGGAAASRRHFDRARELFPDEPLARVAEAETYAVLVQDEKLFDRLLAEARASGARGERAAEDLVARRRAAELEARKARLF